MLPANPARTKGQLKAKTWEGLRREREEMSLGRQVWSMLWKAECFKKGCNIIKFVTLVSVWKWIEIEKARAGETKPKELNRIEPIENKRRDLEFYVNKH